MAKRLYFFVSLHDALRMCKELSQLGVNHYHVLPHDMEVAFVFERASDMTQLVLRRLFGTDGVSQPD
ncbi:hypothetical protein [Brevibacillus borstelensis]|uniref:hypothetical protein n=1 Tax=Brevibacillus borstelensis TaxID=45462 RepID=UPI0030C4C026